VLHIEGENLKTLWQHESQVVMLFFFFYRSVYFFLQIVKIVALKLSSYTTMPKVDIYRLKPTLIMYVNIAGTSAVEGIVY
jgi:hypothetical protein